MKLIRSGLGVMVLILAGAVSAPAQFWNAAVQATESVYDDRNAALIHYMDQNWLFWDRDTGGDRQIFYRILSAEGEMLGDEIQLTFGPGSNFALKLTDSPPLLCWEHQEGEQRDVLFAYLQAGVLSPIMAAFDSERDEYAPWPAIAYQYVSPQNLPHFIITAQEDSAILVKDWKLEDGELNLVQAERWPMPGRIEYPSCAKSAWEWKFSCMWQLSSATDTLIQWRNYDGQTGWGLQYDLQISGLQAFNPFLLSSSSACFNNFENSLVKTAECSGFNSGGTWFLDPDVFEGFNGNQFDPYAESYFGLLVFFSDIGGDFDVYCGDPDEPIGSSDSADVNPCATTSLLYQTPNGGYFCYLCAWESNRNENWDIYYAVSETMVGMNGPLKGQVLQPDGIALSVHPNPGNTEFRIELELPMSGEVEAAVYDLSGRRVAKIHDGWMGMGSHDLIWNAQGFPSGIYLLHAETNGMHQTEKLVLMK